MSKDISGGTQWKHVCKKVYHYSEFCVTTTLVLKTPTCINPTIVWKWAICYAVRNRFVGRKVMYNFWETVFGTWYQPCKASPVTYCAILHEQSCQYPFCSDWNNCWRQFIVVLYYAVMSSYYITIFNLCTLLWQIKCITIINMLSYNNIEHY